MGFSRQEYWSELPFPSPEDLPDPGIEIASLVLPALQADSLYTELSGNVRKLKLEFLNVISKQFAVIILSYINI